MTSRPNIKIDTYVLGMKGDQDGDGEEDAGAGAGAGADADVDADVGMMDVDVAGGVDVGADGVVVFARAKMDTSKLNKNLVAVTSHNNRMPTSITLSHSQAIFHFRCVVFMCHANQFRIEKQFLAVCRIRLCTVN